jgi:hypothetical protein
MSRPSNLRNAKIYERVNFQKLGAMSRKFSLKLAQCDDRYQNCIRNLSRARSRRPLGSCRPGATLSRNNPSSPRYITAFGGFEPIRPIQRRISRGTNNYYLFADHYFRFRHEQDVAIDRRGNRWLTTMSWYPPPRVFNSTISCPPVLSEVTGGSRPRRGTRSNYEPSVFVPSRINASSEQG